MVPFSDGIFISDCMFSFKFSLFFLCYHSYYNPIFIHILYYVIQSIVKDVSFVNCKQMLLYLVEINIMYNII